MISILIRTRNEAAWIGRTLEAVLEQDLTDHEIIIVDSGSDDATLAIAERYPVRLLQIPQESFTYGRALNTGARAARGEWIVSLSAHAIPADRSWLARLVRALEDPRVAGAASRQDAHPGDRLDGHRALWQGLYSLGVRTPVVERYLFSNAASAVRADLWRRYAFDEVLGHCEDHSWALQMQNLGYQVRYVPGSVVLHSHHVPLAQAAQRGRQEMAALRKVYGWTWASGARPRKPVRRELRAAVFLARYNRRGKKPGKPGVRLRTRAGTAFDLYDPGTNARRTVVLVYGFTLEGELDPRLVAFAQALSETRLRAAVPVLPGLKSFRFLVQDLDALEDLLAELNAQDGRPVAIVAFSVGAALALAAASAPPLRDLVDPLLLLGPSCDLAELWTGFCETSRRPPVTEKEWDHAIFVRGLLAYRCRDRLNLTPAEERELVQTLASYCRRASLEEKKSFYERVLRQRESQVLGLQALEQEVVHSLCSEETVSGVRSRVLVLHDPFDHVVPPDHARRLYDMLRQRRGCGGERFVLTSFLAHASERRGRGIAETLSGIAALDLMGELLE